MNNISFVSQPNNSIQMPQGTMPETDPSLGSENKAGTASLGSAASAYNSDSSNALALKLLQNTSTDQSTLKALTVAGLEITNDTVSMVKEMMSTGLPIDKSSLLEMSKNLSMFQGTSISTMVEMKSLNIPITENNIVQFGNYKNYEHQVINDMTNIIDALPDAFNMLSESGNTNGAIKLYGEVLKLFTENNVSAPESTAQNNAVTESQIGILSENGEGVATSSTMNGVLTADNAASAGNGDVTNAASLEMSQDTETVGLAGENAQNPLAESLQGKTLQNAESSFDALNRAASEQDINDPSLNGKVISQGQENLILKGEVQNKAFSQSFLDNLRNLNVSEGAIESLTKDPGQLFKELLSSFEDSSLTNPVETAAWKKLFSSEEYNKLLKDSIESQWLLKPDDVEKKENIQNFYERLGKEAKALANVVNNSPLAGTNLAQSANNLSNNLDFMNQLNQMFQYVQLPLLMNSQTAHGDLYVYQNKHKKLSEDGSVSAVLHLDMENLGPVDVFVKLLDSKVTTNFYVMDDSTLTLINDNIHILNERLEKRGYSLQVNLKLHDDEEGEDAALDEMLNVSRTTILSTTSFDARA